ncbi:MAG: SDR family NAD(P)-dependent oxidoreductase [Pseudomonadota bacterium]
MKPLAGKVAICTGSGRPGGLGQGILHKLAADGADVVVTDLGRNAELLDDGDIGNTDEMEATAEALREHGTRVLVRPCDVRDPAAVQALVDASVAEFGRLDIMVNNAGVGFVMKPLLELKPEDWDLVIDVNLTGAFYGSQAAAAQMVRLGDGGRIINIASQAAKSGFPHMAPYCASKHGMIGLTRTCAIDLGSHGITVNAVCPNHVTTGLGAKQNEYFAKFRGVSVEDYRAALAARIPLGRPGLTDDTANAVAWLASDAAQYITGEALNVSGGEEMH